jgi:hypothetical protein
VTSIHKCFLQGDQRTVTGRWKWMFQATPPQPEPVGSHSLVNHNKGGCDEGAGRSGYITAADTDWRHKCPTLTICETILYTRYTCYRVYFIWQLLYMFRSPAPIFRSTKQQINMPPTTHSNQFQLFQDSSRQQYGVTVTRCCSYSCFVLLKMGVGDARNM